MTICDTQKRYKRYQNEVKIKIGVENILTISLHNRENQLKDKHVYKKK